MSNATKTIIIGLDGLEPTIVEPMIQQGELPCLAALRERGGYTRLATTYPAQTPVAWSTFSTGMNPGGHGIFDFLSRDAKTYLPQIGLNRYEQKSPFLPPKLVNLRDGKTVWEVLTEAGKSSTVIRCPCSYPPSTLKGRLLAGMGVPDLRGSFGVSTFYTSRPDVEPLESESVVHVDTATGNDVKTYLPGPLNPKTRQPSRLEIRIDIDQADGRARIHVDQQSVSVEVRQGAWSDWLPVKFKTGLLQSASGIVRFYLVRTEPAFELYASPVNFDPAKPVFPISAPEEYSGRLAEAIGPFYTTGMVEDHTGLINGRIDEDAYLDQCEEVWQQREAMMLHELERFDEGLFFCLYDTPDRIQHMFWRFREPDHPSNNGDDLAPYRRVVEDHYKVCDEMVGKAFEYADDQTLFVVLSDHGFGSFRRGVNLNTWLYQQGLLKLADGVRPGPDAGDYLRNIDWSSTKAYALGLGGIYINLQGREEQGIVSEDDAESLKRKIADNLTGLQDACEDAVSVTNVSLREEIYHGPHVGDSPDLLVNFTSGYRASWDTALGGVPQDLFCDNQRRWSGDHVIDPALVPGVLFMNQPFHATEARMLDLAPTILNALATPVPGNMEGESLLL